MKFGEQVAKVGFYFLILGGSIPVNVQGSLLIVLEDRWGCKVCYVCKANTLPCSTVFPVPEVGCL